MLDLFSSIVNLTHDNQRGTGFLISVKSTVPGIRHRHLVTTKENAMRLSAGKWRINEVPASKTAFYFHDTAPLAIAFLDPAKVAFKAGAIPETALLNSIKNDRAGINVGDAVHVPQRAGSKLLVRRGILSLLDSDTILVESEAIARASGAPVFVRPVLTEEESVQVYENWNRRLAHRLPDDLFLLGMSAGPWAGAGDGSSDDLALILPAQSILDILHVPEIVAARKIVDEAEYARIKEGVGLGAADLEEARLEEASMGARLR